jgi:hypothetical protein
MNTWDPTLRPNPSFTPQPAWFEVFLPVGAAPLLLLLFLILPIFLLAGESLFAPVYEWVHSQLMPVNAGMTYTELPLLLIFKIILFCIFTFTGVALLILKINCLYYEVWSYWLKEPHPLHTQYHPDPQDSMIALFNWGVFRWFKILSPFLGWFILAVLSGIVLMWFFNTYSFLGVFTFQLQIMVSFFVMAVLGFFTFLGFFKMLWRLLTSILGDAAAITEPEKPAQVIFDRVQKLAFASPWIVLLYPLYFVFYVVILAEVVLLMANFDITDILAFHPDALGLIYGLTAATMVAFLVLSALKFLAYHDALGRFYNRVG